MKANDGNSSGSVRVLSYPLPRPEDCENALGDFWLLGFFASRERDYIVRGLRKSPVTFGDGSCDNSLS